MKILAIEFSPSQRSVSVVQAIGDLAPSTLGSRAEKGQFRCHEVIETGSGATRALDLVDEALRQAGLEREQIEGLAIGLGPGSYTGIRAAIALAHGWQLATHPGELRLLGISSVEGLAVQAQAEGFFGSVNVIIDAQRNEFYLARYEITQSERREVEPLRLATWSEVREREQARAVLIGPEVTRWFPSGRVIFPRAEMLGKLAHERSDFVTGDKLEPIYLRETTFVKAPPPRVIV